jgi:hypothetical protein
MSVDEALKLNGLIGIYPWAIGEEPVAGRIVMREYRLCLSSVKQNNVVFFEFT